MGPKVTALIDFVEGSKKKGVWAAVGDLRDVAKIVIGEEGTFVKQGVPRGCQMATWQERTTTKRIQRSTSFLVTLNSRKKIAK